VRVLAEAAEGFRFSDAVTIMGKANFSRLSRLAKSLGALDETGGVYRKLVD
jgi:hypothetical protein